jgi:hypothetical protein
MASAFGIKNHLVRVRCLEEFEIFSHPRVRVCPAFNEFIHSALRRCHLVCGFLFNSVARGVSVPAITRPSESDVARNPHFLLPFPNIIILSHTPILFPNTCAFLSRCWNIKE